MDSAWNVVCLIALIGASTSLIEHLQTVIPTGDAIPRMGVLITLKWTLLVIPALMGIKTMVMMDVKVKFTKLTIFFMIFFVVFRCRLWGFEL